MSKQTLHALCFYLSSLDPQILFAFDAMKVKRILQSADINEDFFDLMKDLESKEYRLFARFFNGKLVRLGEDVKFTILHADHCHPVPSFLTQWAQQHGITAIYHQDNCFHLLLHPPKEGDAS